MGEERFMVIDVESIGLHGEGFAVAYVVVGTGGTVYEEKRFACPPDAAQGTDRGRAWVKEHVPVLTLTGLVPRDVRRQFWVAWLYWKARGVRMIADCGWPVEANFLSACIADDPEVRVWQGPYPLLDLSGFLVAIDLDPLAERARLVTEPQHDPQGDARQSARILVDCLKILQPQHETLVPSD